MTENVLIRVCDDDEDVRRSWQFVLEGEGWNVRIYPDALTFLKEDDPLVPGCLILDVRMPGMTGIELQHEMALRSHVLPVIFVSGHGDINMAVKTIKDGAEDFLPKPVETLRLIETSTPRRRTGSCAARGARRHSKGTVGLAAVERTGKRSRARRCRRASQ